MPCGVFKVHIPLSLLLTFLNAFWVEDGDMGFSENPCRDEPQLPLLIGFCLHQVRRGEVKN